MQSKFCKYLFINIYESWIGIINFGVTNFILMKYILMLMKALEDTYSCGPQSYDK